jgi:hypothetical protein
VIYTPRFRILYRNTKTNEEKSLEFDGVTAKKIPTPANVRKA